MDILKMCLNWKVVVILAAVGVGVALIAPSLLVAAVPLLVFAACPLSMLLMMAAMGGMKGGRRASGLEQEHESSGTQSRNERLADLKARLAQLQDEQAALTRAVADLEGEEATTAGRPQMRATR
jgi:Sec-independent protein translocase protein TatA